jgi:hypothetical protein
VEDLLVRGWEELFSRDSGPLHLRLIVQPLLASVLAMRDGRKDAREGRPTFFLRVVREPEKRRALLRDAWKSVGKVFLTAVAFDVIYQLIALQGIRPGQTLIVATVLAIIPYLVVRGLTNRIVTQLRTKSPQA